MDSPKKKNNSGIHPETDASKNGCLKIFWRQLKMAPYQGKVKPKKAC
jgi:hypothetical protein